MNWSESQFTEKECEVIVHRMKASSTDLTASFLVCQINTIHDAVTDFVGLLMDEELSAGAVHFVSAILTVRLFVASMYLVD